MGSYKLIVFTVFVIKKGILIFRRHSTVPELYDWLITSNSHTIVFISLWPWEIAIDEYSCSVHSQWYMYMHIYMYADVFVCFFFNHTTLSFLCLNVFIVHYKYILYIFPLGPKSHQLNCTLKIKNVLVKSLSWIITFFGSAWNWHN